MPITVVVKLFLIILGNARLSCLRVTKDTLSYYSVCSIRERLLYLHLTPYLLIRLAELRLGFENTLCQLRWGHLFANLVVSCAMRFGRLYVNNLSDLFGMMASEN